MGTNHTAHKFAAFSLSCVLGVSFGLGVSNDANAQNRVGTQQAYYQPLTRQQYQQHGQATYQEQYRAPNFGPPNSRVAPGLSLQERADRLLQEADQTAPVQNNFAPANNNMRQFPRRLPASNAGFRRQEQDPFGDPIPGAQDPTPATPKNQFEPFADPPAEAPKTQQPTTDPFGDPRPSVPQNDPFGDPIPKQDPFGDPPARDPFGDPPTQPEKQPNVPETLPRGTQEPRVDPFADPPKQRPEPETTQDPMPEQGRDPVLPDDAQLNPTPDLAPPMDPTPDNSDVDYPPGTVEPDDTPGQLPTDPFKDPVEPKADPLAPPEYIPPSGIYKAPSSNNNLPPIVQPGMVAPPYQMQPRSYPQPGYQPAYQPIPGAPAQPYPQPGYAQPDYAQPGYAQPGYSQPSYQQQPVYQQQTSTQPQYAGQMNGVPVAEVNDVYSPVVEDACQACPDSGCPNFYFGSFGGGSLLRDVEAINGSSTLETDDGSVFGFSIGRRNGRNLRSELEFAYRQNDITGFTTSSITTPLEGELNSYAGMANAYWEFIDVPTRYLKPYIGTGIGFVSFDGDVRTPGGSSIVPAGTENDTSFAFQYMAGINYKAYRNMDLYAEYRFVEADSYRVEATPAVTGNYKLKSDNILFGLRWKF